MRSLAIIPILDDNHLGTQNSIRTFINKPIIAYPIEKALKSELFDEVIVATKNEEIIEIIKDYGVHVPFIPSLTTLNKSNLVDGLIKILEGYKQKGIFFKYVCCINPMATLLSNPQLKLAFSKLKRENLYSVIPVTPYHYPVQKALELKADRLNIIMPEYNTDVSELPTSYYDCEQFYWFEVNALLEKKQLITEKSGAVILSEMEVQTIDREEDWKLAEIKYKFLNQKHEKENLLQSKRA
jgi:N-acylneuraminate cytidylyltransferase